MLEDLKSLSPKTKRIIKLLYGCVDNAEMYRALLNYHDGLVAKHIMKTLEEELG